MNIRQYAQKAVDIGARCFDCHAPLQADQIESYDHSGGWHVDGFSKLQWLYFECDGDHCHYQTSFAKLGFERPNGQIGPDGCARCFEYPPISPGTPVQTTQPNLDLRDEWTSEGWVARKFSVFGVVINQRDSHGLCYGVIHEDGTMGYYDPSELEVVK